MQTEAPYTPSAAPVGQIRTDRGLLKLIILSFLTLGIYSIVFYSGVSNDINIIASRYDGKKTMHYALLLFLAAPFTFSIAYFVWFHRISNRIGGELRRRNVPSNFSASTFWLWNILGSLIVIGPFVYIYKLCQACNDLAAHYNHFG